METRQSAADDAEIAYEQKVRALKLAADVAAKTRRSVAEDVVIAASRSACASPTLAVAYRNWCVAG